MKNNNILKVGTDFSGIGAPEQALTNLGINYKSVFACEIDKFARKSYEAIHPKPETFYNDITERNHAEVEQLDLYVAGFPCQAFSIAGSRKGFDDVRGTLFFNVADFIRINQPKCFVLENVKGLLSHNNGATFQTIVSLLSDNGGTANGQVSIPYFEDGLGYHIYYSVLNSKNHGVPQNRERIFIVGFRDFRSFSFPKSETLNIKLKDVLQDNSNYKYFLSDKGSKYVSNPMRLKKKFTQINGDIALTVMAQCMQSCVGDFIDVDDKYFLSDKTLSKLNIETEQGTMIKKSVKNEISTCIDASYYKGFGIRNGVCRQVVKVTSATKKGYEEAEYTACNQAVVHNIAEQVKIRKFQVDITALQKCLKKHKKYSNKVISEKLQVKKTTVDHWFRTDKHFSIPDSNIWLKLKELLNIKIDIFDKSITTFIIKDGVFEKSNRVYDETGISPTLTKVSAGERILINNYRIRRLTPLECWRLQSFPDEQLFKAQAVNSDTQLYKQAGNSITVRVIQKIISKIYETV